MGTEYTRNGRMRIAFEDLGGLGGEPLLLAMGLAASRFWWPPALIDALIERGFHVVAYDQRDSGESEHAPDVGGNPITALFRKNPAAYTSEDMVDDAIAVMDTVGWETAHVFGHSLGGLIAQRLPLRHPTRIRSAASSAAVPSDAGRWRLSRYLRLGFLARLARMKFPDGPEGDHDFGMAVSRALASPGYPFDEAAASLRVKSDKVNPFRDTKAQSRQSGAHWSGPRLAELKVPLLVMHGASDQLLRVRAARDIAAAVPGARLLILPGVGHDLPGELCARYADEVRANADRAVRED